MGRYAKRVRPDVDGIEATIAAVQDGRLDGRTRQAQALAKTRQALIEEPDAALRALLRHNLAVGALVQNEILKSLQGIEMIDETGRIPEIVSKDLLKVQRGIVQSAALLAQFEGILPTRGKGKGGKLDTDGGTIADVILTDSGESYDSAD